MIFIGGGALLAKAVADARAIGLAVDFVCCTPGDPALPKLDRLGVRTVLSVDPSGDLAARLSGHADRPVFSINNKYILTDELLSSGPAFFNIHSGLVQRYLGIAEICIFAAVSRGESDYGVTLHRILPGQNVDSGPVVDQVGFAIESGKDTFYHVMNASLRSCQAIFARNVAAIVRGTHRETRTGLSDRAFVYRDLPRLIEEAAPEPLERACRLGIYEGFLPRLAEALPI